MANLTSLSQYEAETRIPTFHGLMQHGDGINGDPRFAVDMENVDTSGGGFKPFAQPVMMEATLPAKIETLAVLHRRWYVGADASKNMLIAASGGQLYYMQPGGTAWTQFANPKDTYQSNLWSWVSYEINPEGATTPVDVLVLSNPKDGMVYLRCDDTAKTVTMVTTPKKFGVIARFNERIWGGGIADDPDMVVYSAPYDFTNWEANAEIPEDGAGDIQQPTWDGDRFTALKQLGPQLIAFRRNSVWRVLGTDPGEFVWRQQYGGGTTRENTICIDGERMLMLGDRGVMQYDGLAVAPFDWQYAEAFFRTMNTAALDQSCACIWQEKYYLAVPTEGSVTNNAVLIHDTRTGTWLLRRDIGVETFLPTDDALYFTSTAAPGRISRMVDDVWTADAVSAPIKWVSPWLDLGYKNAQKGGWQMYFVLEAMGAGQVVFKIETEKKVKAKSFDFLPTIGHPRQKRLSFGGSGRRFRIHIESISTAPWRLLGGLQITTEFDKD